MALYWDLYVPTEEVEEKGSGGEGETSTLLPLLIAVHGYGAHKRYMMREARMVAGERFVIAAIQAPHQHYRTDKKGEYRVGFGWLSEHKPDEYVRLHHKFVLDVIDKLAGEGLIDAKRVYMYGFSQACALNFRFAFTYPDVLKGIVGVCGGVPGDLETNEIYKCRQVGTETFYLYGDDDEFYTQEQFAGFDEKLNSRLANYTSKHYAAKHEITDEMRTDIRAWLAAR